MIVATGEPFVLFRYARELSREFGIPWIADYRDPWSDDRTRRGKRISKAWEARLERLFTSTASALTTVSEFVGDTHTQGKPLHVIPNGYDPEAVAGAAEEPQSGERLTLAYVGSIHPYNPLESFLEVCEAFVREREAPCFELLFVGLGDQAAVEEILASRFPLLARFATFYGRLPNNEAVHVLSHANAFVLFNNYAFPGTKIFDYLALRRRVLLCYSADPEALELKARHFIIDDSELGEPRIMESLLDETGAGTVVRDAAHLREVLADLYDEFLQDGRVACDSHGIGRFSRHRQAGRMAEVVKEVAAQ